MKEQTLVLLKPDAVQKSLMGRIISRFESSGLKIKAIKMLQATEDLAKKHYPLDEKWALSLFKKTKAAYDQAGKKMEFDNHLEHGSAIQSRLQKFLIEGPVIALVLEGQNAIQLVRKLTGHTEPRQAEKGTIRGDFASEESYEIADKEKRAIRNLVHASDSKETAEREISVWFSKNEIHNF